MDPDGKRTSTRAVLLAAAGQNCWPPAGSYMAATGQDLMAADNPQLIGPQLIVSSHPHRTQRTYEPSTRTMRRSQNQRPGQGIRAAPGSPKTKRQCKPTPGSRCNPSRSDKN